MRVSLLLICAVLVFSGVSVKAEARELTPACAAEKEKLINQAKAAYLPLDTTVHDELMAEARDIERFCTDERLLERINVRYSRQQKAVVNLQQDLAKAGEERHKQSWIDNHTARLRAAQEQLQAIEEERNALLAAMGMPTTAITPVDGQETPVQDGLLTEPLAKDSPAYNE